jgi:large subunit ribosomal protein L9
MEIILKQDVKNLGYKDDVVKVRAGYGRNYLLPKGIAITADESNKKMLTETKKQRAFKEEKIKKAAETMLSSLNNMIVKVGAKVGESGKIFGSVNAIQLADAIKKLGIEVDRKNILLKDDIKSIGTYTAEVRLHKEITAKVTFEVVAE